MDLTPLTDDQLVELARLVAVEAIIRNPAVVDAAQSAVRDAIATARQSQDVQWVNKKWLATMVSQCISTGCALTVWRTDDGTRTRVYIDHEGSDRKGREKTKWCYHVTGDSKNPPGSLTKEEGSRGGLSGSPTLIKLICKHAVALFSAVRIDCDQAQATQYQIPPMPADVAEALEALAAKAAKAAARNAYHKAIYASLHADVEALEKSLLVEHNVDYSFHLPADKQTTLDALRKAAIDEVIATMKRYDVDHGAAQ